MLQIVPALALLALGLAAAPGAALACDPYVGPCPPPAATARRPVAALGAGRPAGCPRAWCGCWLARHLGLGGDRSLWAARNWAYRGRPAAGPAPGVVAVFARGRRGGHVGLVTAVPRPGVVVLLSGNDGGRVRERVRSTRGVIAWRRL